MVKWFLNWNWVFRKKEPSVYGVKEFKILWRISFPAKNGWIETSHLTTTIKDVNSEKEAVEKLKRFAKSKIKIIVISIDEKN